METMEPTKSKLTLSMRADVIEYGKQLAKRQGTNLSRMLQDYLEERRRAESAPVTDLEELGRQLRAIEFTDEMLQEAYNMIPEPPKPLPDIPYKQLRREANDARAKRKGISFD